MVFLRSAADMELGETQDHHLPTLSERFLVFSPHILNLHVNGRSLGWPSPISGLSLRRSQFSANLTSQWDISSGPLWGEAQIHPGLTSHHVCPTGADLARTQASLEAMNHRFIFLGHMWVKLFDVNHTLPASVCNRRVLGCHWPLAAPSPYTVLRLEMSTFFLCLAFPDPCYWVCRTVYFGRGPTLQSWLPMPTQDRNS